MDKKYIVGALRTGGFLIGTLDGKDIKFPARIMTSPNGIMLTDFFMGFSDGKDKEFKLSCDNFMAFTTANETLKNSYIEFSTGIKVPTMKKPRILQ